MKEETLNFQKLLYEPCDHMVQGMSSPICGLCKKICIVGMQKPWSMLGYCPLHKQVLSPDILPFHIDIRQKRNNDLADQMEELAKQIFGEENDV